MSSLGGVAAVPIGSTPGAPHGAAPAATALVPPLPETHSLRANPLPSSERLPASLFPTAYPIPLGQHLTGAPRPLSHRVGPSDDWNNSGYSFPGSDYNWSLLNASCYGIWPGTQSGYLDDCYGHDEPGLEAYSTLPGSGGNVTWNLQLPVDASPADNQSNLYAAIWFGLVLTDPYAWMDQCYLELQFYPDSSFTTSSAYEQWAAVAVGWQIEASTGYEDACFYQPLTFDTDPADYYSMAAGDSVSVTMTGWQHSANGETLSIDDTTSRQASTVQMYNYYQGYALDPAYATNSYSNALEWTSGGELPVAFAFETGHTVAPYPNNNSYGGCSAGAPPPTPVDPAVPCPSYDPGFWLNDTRTPWQIAPPIFFNAAATQVGRQIVFSQDLGGISFIDPISGGACDGRDGSAFCSYPWYSYSCSAAAFEFGATDYPGVSDDFGQYNQYSVTPVYNDLGVGYYPLHNFSLPACGATNFTVGITGAPGLVHFLHSEVGAATAFPGLLAGNYSVTALPPAGEEFQGWTTTGALVISEPLDPWSNLEVDGNGTLSAVYAVSVPTVAVTFDDTGGHGRIQVVAGFASQLNATNSTLASGGVLDLIPGRYSVNALPDAGYNFSQWSANDTGGRIGAYTFPFTWLTVVGNLSAVLITAAYTHSTSKALIQAYSYGEFGSIYVDGTLLGYGGEVNLPVGTYTVAAVPSPGSVVNYLSISGSAVSLIAGDTSNVTFENGTSYVIAYFAYVANVTLDDAPAGGSIAFAALAPAPNGTVVPVEQYYPSDWSAVAVPPAGMVFAEWSVSSGAELGVADPTAPATQVLVNGTGTLTALYAAASTLGSLTVRTVPADGGTVTVGFGAALGNGSVNSSVPAGTYLLSAQPAAGFSFVGWSTSGGAGLFDASTIGYLVGVQFLTFDGTAGTVTANFVALAPVEYAVSFYSSPAGSTAIVDGAGLPAGVSVRLAPGLHTLIASVFAATVGGWSVTSNLSIVSSSGNATTFFVNGSGAVYVLAGPLGFLDASVSPLSGTAPLTVDYAVAALGGTLSGPVNWSFSDGSPNSTTAVGSHVFTDPGTYGINVSVPFAGHGTLVGGFTVVATVTPLTVGVLANVTDGAAPLAVGFSANAHGGQGPLTYLWAFGDGGAASGANASHTYATPGTYNATVVVSDPVGQHSNSTVRIVVLPAISVVLTASPSTGAAPLYVSFSAVVTGGTMPYLYSWSFGDGGGGQLGPSPFHTYFTPGAFAANVTVVDQFGGRASASQSVEVTVPVLSGTLVASPSTLLLGGTTTFTATVSGGEPPFSYVWAGLPAGCVPANASLISCVPSAVGVDAVTVGVTDAAGQHLTLSTSLDVTAQRTATTPASAGPGTTEYLLIGGATGALIVVVAAVVLLRRRRPPSEEPPPPDGTEP